MKGREMPQHSSSQAPSCRRTNLARGLWCPLACVNPQKVKKHGCKSLPLGCALGAKQTYGNKICGLRVSPELQTVF